MAITNPQLIPGVSRLSRSQAYAKKALFKKPKAASAAKKTVAAKESKVYEADDVPAKKVSRKTAKPTKLRSSITPGTVLILLSGRFRGKRVVFLKQLDSGLLLVTGPHKINGVPARRVNQAYVIATSTKLDLSTVKVNPKFNDEYFKVDKALKSKPTAAALFGEGNEKPVVSATRVSDQKALDTAILAQVKKTVGLKQYLNASFALSKGQYPHDMKF